MYVYRWIGIMEYKRMGFPYGYTFLFVIFTFCFYISVVLCEKLHSNTRDMYDKRAEHGRDFFYSLSLLLLFSLNIIHFDGFYYCGTETVEILHVIFVIFDNFWVIFQPTNITKTKLKIIFILVYTSDIYYTVIFVLLYYLRMRINFFFSYCSSRSKYIYLLLIMRFNTLAGSSTSWTLE